MARPLLSFPNPVDEISARIVAGGVVLLGTAFVVTEWTPLVLVLAYGFLARVATGPTLSPLGQFATRVIRPRLPVAPRPTAGPPKRFAQAIGATLSVSASVAVVAFDALGVGQVLVGAIVVAAGLESVLGFCLGCRIFALLMRAGLVPASVCEECADISGRLAATSR